MNPYPEGSTEWMLYEIFSGGTEPLYEPSGMDEYHPDTSWNTGNTP